MNILPSVGLTHRVPRHRIRTLAVSILILASGVWAFSGGVEAQTAPSFTILPAGASMLSGSNRFEVAVSAARAAYPDATTAILASGAAANETDPLIASPLASELQAPILLTDSASAIGSTTLNALSSMKISTVVLVGAVAANVSTIKAQLPHGIVVRAAYGNANPTDTAANVASALAAAEGVTTFSSVFVVSDAPQNLSDLISAAPQAAMTRSPIFLVPPSATASLPTNEATDVNSAGTIYAVGAATAFNFTATSTTTKLVPLTGASRSQTLLAVDNAFVPNATGVFIVNGENNDLQDALAIAPLVAEQKAALLFLYDANRATPTGTEAFLSNTTQADSVTNMTLVGGASVVPTIDYTMLETDFPSLGDGVKTLTVTPSTTTPTADSIIDLTASVTSDAGKTITTAVAWTVTGSNSQDAIIESTGADSAAMVAVDPGTYAISATVDGTTQTTTQTIAAAATTGTASSSGTGTDSGAAPSASPTNGSGS